MLRIAVVGDDPLARSGLAGALVADGDLVVVTQVPPGQPIAAADVVLFDVGVAGAGVEALRRITTPVLALVPSRDLAARAMAVGARGVLPRDAVDRLGVAVRAVAAGLVVLDDDFAESVLRAARPEIGPVALTPREQEVLGLMAEGLSNKLIADRLGISDHTAKFHVNAILGKLGVTGRTEAVMQAVRLGLVLV